MHFKTLEACRKLLVCENCHRDSDSLLKVKIKNSILSKKPYSIKKLCFGCVRKNKLSIEWKGSYWKKIFAITA